MRRGLPLRRFVVNNGRLGRSDAVNEESVTFFRLPYLVPVQTDVKSATFFLLDNNNPKN